MVEGWTKRDSEKQALLDKVQVEATTLREQHSEQQQVLNTLEDNGILSIYNLFYIYIKFIL